MSAVKSERYRIKEMELEYALQMQREKLLAEAFLQPPGIYLVGLGGSTVVAFFAAAMKPEAKRTKEDTDLLEKGLAFLIGTQLGIVPGMAALFASEYKSNPLAGVFAMAAGGGVGLFTTLLLLNEMKPDGSGDGGGVLGTLLAGV